MYIYVHSPVEDYKVQESRGMTWMPVTYEFKFTLRVSRAKEILMSNTS